MFVENNFWKEGLGWGFHNILFSNILFQYCVSNKKVVYF